MRVPPGYAIVEILSPGPGVLVASATGPGGRPCIIKAAANDRMIAGLGREASVLRALESANVDGVPRPMADGGTWIVFERLPMGTLAQSAEAFRRDAEFRARVAAGALARLALVHDARDTVGALRVVHGDVSPDNVLVGEDGAVALVDFGLARWRGGSPPQDGATRGTLAYVAPEVARGERFDARADDFALAASLFTVATGAPLREARGAQSAQAALLAEAGERPFDATRSGASWRERAHELFPPVIADALLACLAFDARDRPPATPRPVLQPPA